MANPMEEQFRLAEKKQKMERNFLTPAAEKLAVEELQKEHVLPTVITLDELEKVKSQPDFRRKVEELKHDQNLNEALAEYGEYFAKLSAPKEMAEGVDKLAKLKKYKEMEKLRQEFGEK